MQSEARAGEQAAGGPGRREAKVAGVQSHDRQKVHNDSRRRADGGRLHDLPELLHAEVQRRKRCQVGAHDSLAQHPRLRGLLLQQDLR